MTQTATNPQTGETVVLIGNEWKPAEHTATNAKGEKAYFVGGAWMVPETPTKAPETTFGGVAGEIGKGLLRGAGNTAGIIPEGISSVLPPPLGQAVRSGLDVVSAPSRRLVAPSPQNEAERMGATGGEIAGAVLAGGPGATLRRAALTTALPTAGGVVGEQLGGETGKTIGALTPGGVQLAATAAPGIKNAIAAKVGPAVTTFRDLGATPSVGQATDSAFLHGLENLASKFPGGAGVMKPFIERQQATIGARARTGVPAEAAGRAIEKGVTGEGGFIERTKAVWTQLDDAVAAKVPKYQMFQPSNTVQALDDLTRPVKSAEMSTRQPLDARVLKYKENIQTDLANNGGMSFEGLRAIRSRVGAELDDALVTGAKGGELKKLYGALSQDLEAAANQSGAGREFARQNNFWRARMARVEDVLERVIGKGKQPEEIFKAVNPTDPDQANKLRAVMRSLDPSQRKTVTDAVVNRLGRAKASKQDEVGELFSSETFLTNWNKLSPGAKAQLFPNHAMRQNVESIAKVASQIRTGSGIYANPSGTAGSFAAYAVYIGPFAAVGGGLGGVPGAVAASVTAAATANIGAKMLTNPRVAEWLAKPVNPSRPGEAVAHLARLGVIYNQTRDEGLKSELQKFVAGAQQ